VVSLETVREQGEFVGMVVEVAVAEAAEGDAIGGVKGEIGSAALGFDVGGVEAGVGAAVLASPAVEFQNGQCPALIGIHGRVLSAPNSGAEYGAVCWGHCLVLCRGESVWAAQHVKEERTRGGRVPRGVVSLTP